MSAGLAWYWVLAIAVGALALGGLAMARRFMHDGWWH